jgi:hypothetical protein
VQKVALLVVIALKGLLPPGAKIGGALDAVTAVPGADQLAGFDMGRLRPEFA